MTAASDVDHGDQGSHAACLRTAQATRIPPIVRPGGAWHTDPRCINPGGPGAEAVGTPPASLHRHRNSSPADQ